MCSCPRFYEERDLGGAVRGELAGAIMDRDTAVALAEYMMRELPSDGRGGFDDQATSAYEMALDLLDRLGFAEISVGRCAARITNPQLPAVLPRHDDACAVLLNLGDQHGDILFRKTGDEEGARIQPGSGTWAADASDDVAKLLERMGLVEGGTWTPEAETMLWRACPIEWPDPDFGDDPRVSAAIKKARDMPDDVRQMIDEAMARPEAELRRYFVQRAVEERWRLADGWILEGPDDPSWIHIFHDPLAAHVCKRIFSEMPTGQSAA